MFQKGTSFQYEVSDIVLTHHKLKRDIHRAQVLDYRPEDSYGVRFMDGKSAVRKGSDMNLIFRFPK